MLWYLLNLSIILVFVILFLIARQTNKRWSKINDYLGMVTNTVNSVRYGNLSTKIEEINHPTYQNVTDSINRMVETLNDREKMIVEYQTELMRQNKLLESVINSLSDGILIINDKHAILRATPQISEWFGAKGQEIIGTNIFDYISFQEAYKLIMRHVSLHCFDWLMSRYIMFVIVFFYSSTNIVFSFFFISSNVRSNIRKSNSHIRKTLILKFCKSFSIDTCLTRLYIKRKPKVYTFITWKFST